MLRCEEYTALLAVCLAIGVLQHLTSNVQFPAQINISLLTLNKFALLRGEAQLCLPYHTGDSEAYYVVFDVNFVICLRYLSVIFVPLLSVYPSVHINA